MLLCLGALALGLAVLGLDGGKVELFARAAVHGLPEAQVLVHVPGEEPDPGLNVVVQLERDVLAQGNLAGGVGDLVLWPLVFYLEDSPGESQARRGWDGATYRLGSIFLPSALRLSFFMAMGPRFRRWSALGLVMMESQMTAELDEFWPAAEGQSAVT